MEGRKPKKVTATKSKIKGRVKATTTQGKSSVAPKRQSVVPVQKKPVAKTAHKNPIVKKLVAKKTTKRTQLHPATVTGLVQPLTVHAVTGPMLKRSAYVHRWSLHHNFVIILTLTITAVIAMAMIAGYTQTTLQQIESLETSSTSLMKPTATATRFFTTPAGEVTLTLPVTWAMTDASEHRITYTHATLPNTTITVGVETNDTDNVFTWLQAHEPSYTDATVVASAEAVSALRGVTVAATSLDGIPMTVIYLPIQKNLGERYIVSIQAITPEDSTLVTAEALKDIASNLEVK